MTTLIRETGPLNDFYRKWTQNISHYRHVISAKREGPQSLFWV